MRFRAVVVTCLLGLCGMDSALALTRYVTYALRQDPTDPTSPAWLKITLCIKSGQQAGSSTAWEVDEVTIREFNASGGVIRTWNDTTPAVDTTDGLWWVTHADPAAPVVSEFAELPWVEGAATSSGTLEPLEYSIRTDSRESEGLEGVAMDYTLYYPGWIQAIREYLQEWADITLEYSSPMG